MNTKAAIRVLIPFIFAAAVCVFFKPVRSTLDQLIFLFGLHDADTIKGYTASFGVWAPAVSFLLMVFQSVAPPLPSFVVVLSNAALFGRFYGGVLSLSGGAAGAALCFAITRFSGREITEKLTGKPAMNKADRFFRLYGGHTILIAGLLPFVPFGMVSYAAGLTPIGFRTFLRAAVIVHLPITLIYSCRGEILTGDAETLMTGLLVIASLLVLAALIVKIWPQNERTKNVEIQ